MKRMIIFVFSLTFLSLTALALAEDVTGFKSLELGMTEKEVKAALKEDPDLQYDSKGKQTIKEQNMYLRPFYFDFMDYKRQQGQLFYRLSNKKLMGISLVFPANIHKKTGDEIRKLRKVLAIKFGESAWKSGFDDEDWDIDGDEELEATHIRTESGQEFVTWEHGGKNVTITPGGMNRRVILSAMPINSTYSRPFIIIYDYAMETGSEDIKRIPADEKEETKKWADEF
jgi:hypothetical protein